MQGVDGLHSRVLSQSEMKRERGSDQEGAPQGDILWQLAEVSAQLHHEQGDRAELLAERTRLLQMARQLGLLHLRSK